MEIHGHVADGFGPVHDAFAANFAERGELGAAFALHVDGECVVDVWAGIADEGSGRPWERDTLQLVFSTTKGLAAICVGLLLERGALDLDDRVAAHWPEFAAHGKDPVTVAQLLSHQAGVPVIDSPISLEEVLAVAPVVAALADQVPLWPPGEAHGYHALTYGWLVGELVRRVDGRSLGRFLRDEIAGPLGGLDAWIGLPAGEEPRVSRLVPAPYPTDPDELALMRRVAGPGTLGARALLLDGRFLIGGGEMAWNRPDVHASEIPAANGITTARALSTIYAACVGEVGGVRLLGPEVVEAMRAEQVRGPDRCLVVDTRFGAGFMLDSPLNPMLGPGSFGHPGAGGSLGYADPEAGVGYGYVMNRMGGGIAGDPRSVALNDAVRACL